MSRHDHKQRTGAEEIIGSVTGIGVMLALFAFSHGTWWWLLIIAAFSVSGIARGIQKLAAQRRQNAAQIPQSAKSANDENIKQILRVAQQYKGIVTPTLVTLHSDLGLEDAERLLQDMSGKGYASMNVTESGRIEYEFPEFMDKLEHSDG